MKNISIAIFISLLFFQFSYSQITKNKIPNWVVLQKYNTHPDIDYDEISEGTVILLFSEQFNIPKQEAFYRTVTKITDNVGIQSASTISATYDPVYQNISFHKVSIIRDGKVIDKLDISNFQSIRRETRADNYVYDGTLNALLNISDVRTGDIVDMSYTVKGFNPIHNGSFSNSFYLNDIEPYGKLYYKFISDKELNYKAYNTTISPKIEKKKGFTYTWIATNTKKAAYENNTPNWKLTYATVFISTYNSWKEVVDWGVDVYDIKTKPNAALLKKIKKIKRGYSNDAKRIKVTLNFVQNEIRYLALSSGIGGYKPFSPNKIFDNRYGDCKDKSILMVAMLREMGIESYPMLVNTNLLNTVTDLPPSHKIFNHCVVKVIDKAKNEYWFDPTISNQGGTYYSTYFPDYKSGLVLKKGNTEFEEIFSTHSNEVEITDLYELEEVGNGAKLTITTKYFENEADIQRNFFKQNSISSINKDYERYLSSYYKSIHATQKPEYKDQKMKNIFTVTEFYKIDSIWQADPNINKKITASFTPYSISDVISIPNSSLGRKTEYALSYPLTRRHHINIKLPEDWSIRKEENTINSDGFYYEYSSYKEYNSDLIQLNYYYQTQKNHVTAEEFNKYTKDITSLNSELAYELYVNNSKGSKRFFSKNYKTIFIWLIIILGIFAIRNITKV